MLTRGLTKIPLYSGPEQRPEAFLLKMPVVVSTSVSPFPAHGLHGDAIGETVSFTAGCCLHYLVTRLNGYCWQKLVRLPKKVFAEICQGTPNPRFHRADRMTELRCYFSL